MSELKNTPIYTKNPLLQIQKKQREIQNTVDDNGNHSVDWEELRKEVVQGFLYSHSRLNANTAKTLEASSFLYALIELMSEKGLISVEELDERKMVVGKRLAEQFRQNGNGVMLQDPEYDKYTFQSEVTIDCENRVHLCQTACCRLPFALSKQDVREGVVCWDLGQPYLIDQGQDGYCNHLDRGTFGCTVYQHRPVPCRAFDCRNDERIWLDFDKKVLNPAVNQPDWPRCLAEKEDQEELLADNLRIENEP